MATTVQLSAELLERLSRLQGAFVGASRHAVMVAALELGATALEASPALAIGHLPPRVRLVGQGAT